jgi:hypothetical protein
MLQMKAYDRCSTVSCSSTCNFKPVDDSACNSCESEADIIPRMNIKTRGLTGNQLLSELNLNLRQDALGCENDVDSSCCGGEVSECARMKVGNNAVGGSDEHCSDISLSDITADPQYHAQLLLDALDTLASGDTENPDVNSASETAGNECVDTAGDCSTPSQMNYEEMELVPSPLRNLLNAHDVGDLPEQTETCETRDADAYLIPIPACEAMNLFEPPSVKSPPQHLAESVLPQVLPSFEKQSMPPVAVVSPMTHSSQLWPQQMRLQQSSANGITYLSVASPTDQAPLTGSFQQLTLQSNSQFHLTESPLSYSLRFAMPTGLGSHDLPAVNQPGADWSSATDASRVRRSVCCFIIL